MFGLSNPIRLVQRPWGDPWSLAQELYLMTTSREERRVEAPVTIAVPPGQVALKLVRDTAPIDLTPLPAPARTALEQARVQEVIRRVSATPDNPRPTRAAELNNPIRPAIADPGDPFRRAIREPDDSVRRRQSIPDVARSPALPPGITDTAATSLPGSTAPRVLSRPASPGDAATNRPAPARDRFNPPTPPPSRGYQAPIFHVDGEARFSGRDPVQFDAPPLIFNPAIGEYQPIDLDASTTHIPDARQVGAGGLMGRVTGGTGDTWQMKVYPSGPDNSDDAEDVFVTCLGLLPSVVAPAGQWFTGIFKSDSEAYYLNPPVWLG